MIQGSHLRASIPKSLIYFMLINCGFLLQVEASLMSFTDALIDECGDLSLCSFSRIMVLGFPLVPMTYALDSLIVSGMGSVSWSQS